MTLTDALTWDNIASRSEGFVWQLLDQTLNPIGTVHPDAKGAQLTWDGTATIQRNLRGLTLQGADAVAVNPISDRIAPSLVIDGTAYPMGVFLFGSVNRLRASRPPSLDGTLVDQAVVLDGEIRTPIGYNQGALITTAMAEVIEPYPVTFEITASSATFGEPAGWQPGSTVNRILSDLCVAAGYLPPFFEANGIGHVSSR